MKIIAVVGLSSNTLRPSNGVARYMQSRGYRIIPVNPNEVEVLGEKSYPRIADVPQKIDLVNILRRVWMQEGVIDEDAARRALMAGLYVVMDRCILKEQMRIKGY